MVAALSANRVGLAAAVAALLIAVGCGANADPARSGDAPPAASSSASKTPKSAEQGEHEHEAPHGGALIELGDEYAHLELVVDPARGTVTAYALDGEAEQPLRLAQGSLEISVKPTEGKPFAIELKPVANELTGERAGDTSQYAASQPGLVKLARFNGTVARVTVRGREFRDVAFAYPEGTEH
jgi:hypothetical protein